MHPGVDDCPGLTRTANGGTFFADAAGRVHELKNAPKLTFKEAATRLGCSVSRIRRLIERAQLYPLCRENARYVRLYAVALDDYRHRTSTPARKPQPAAPAAA